MKALLVTRCGCAKVIDLPPASPPFSYLLPLRAPRLAAMTMTEFPPMDMPERDRRFVLTGKFEYGMYVYEEEP